MRKILVSIDGVSPDQRERIRVAIGRFAEVEFTPSNPGDWSERLSGVDVMFGQPPADALFHSQVKFFQLPSSGYEQYMTGPLKEKPCFSLANARGVTAIAVVEHCLSMMFAFTRRVPLHLRGQEKRIWSRAPRYELLDGSTVAILGMGAIGHALALKCRALGMRTIGVRRDPARGGADKVYAPGEMHLALGEAHHVVLALPASPSGDTIFCEAEFAAMRRDAYFYNLARGSLVDMPALQAALEAGRIAGAGLDVFPEEPLPAESAFWGLPNVIVSPHAGGRFEGEADALIDMFLENFRRYRLGEPLQNLVISNS